MNQARPLLAIRTRWLELFETVATTLAFRCLLFPAIAVRRELDARAIEEEDREALVDG